MPTVTVQPEGIQVDTRAGEGILAALNRSGFGYRIGCRRGGCGICMVDLLSGAVKYDAVVADSVLSDTDRDDGACLSCRAIPVDDVVIQLRNDKLLVTSTLLAAINKVRRIPTQGEH